MIDDDTYKLIKKLRDENAWLRKELGRLKKKDKGVEWRKIPGFERYEASNLGQIRKAADMFGRPAGNVLKPRISNYGHQVVSVYGETRSQQKRSSIHRLVCMAFHGPAPFEGAVVCHNNGIADDNRPENLRWGSIADNAADFKKHNQERKMRVVGKYKHDNQANSNA